VKKKGFIILYKQVVWGPDWQCKKWSPKWNAALAAGILSNRNFSVLQFILFQIFETRKNVNAVWIMLVIYVIWTNIICRFTNKLLNMLRTFYFLVKCGKTNYAEPNFIWAFTIAIEICNPKKKVVFKRYPWITRYHCINVSAVIYYRRKAVNFFDVFTVVKKRYTPIFSKLFA